MANVTDPLITSIQGTDPQNLMEYITRQKIYDSRFWKEHCFGLTAVDVLEGAAKSLTCIGGTFGGNQQPSKFLCFTLKLLQLQPDDDLVQEFIQQDHFKYVRALGAFYLRLTGRPADIYDQLETLYADFAKLKVRGVTEWKLLYMDEFIAELLNPVGGGSNASNNSIGIALPRLPLRETLQDVGYLPEGPRPSALREVIEEAGGLEEYLQYKAKQQRSPAAVALWEKRNKRPKDQKLKPSTSLLNERSKNTDNVIPEEGELASVKEDENQKLSEGRNTTDYDQRRGHMRHFSDDAGSNADAEEGRARKRPRSDRDRNDSGRGYPAEEAKKKTKKPKYGTLFADKKQKRKHSERKDDGETQSSSSSHQPPPPQPPVEGSDEYWNEERAKLGLKPLKR